MSILLILIAFIPLSLSIIALISTIIYAYKVIKNKQGVNDETGF